AREIDAFGDGAVGEHRRGHVIARRLAAQIVYLRERAEDRSQRRELAVAGPALDVARSLDRQHGDLAERLEGHRTLDRRERAQRDRRRARIVERERDETARRQRRAQRDAQESQELEALLLRDQVRAIKQRVDEPREELDQRLTRVADARRPFRNVRGDQRQGLFYEVLEAAIVEGGGTDRHGSTPQRYGETELRALPGAAKSE